MTGRRTAVVLGLVAALLLKAAAGIGGAARADAPPSRIMSPLGLLPASFVGDVATAAGGAQRWQLDILPGGRFQLRRTRVDPADAAPHDTLGRYTIEGRRIALIDVDRRSPQLTLQDDGALVVHGTPAAAAPAGALGMLRRLDPAAPFQPVR